ncbi:TetR family transcriptional regulator [Allosaccharopolyspora coralli]|uniref:TetR family transcriptional regulator n=1 Tax=Allosaccharopolyspora coralli TaxID=2665642 RepID=A0A5Q3QEW8_9PSEU|nr:TetR family transcriptional regulator C-terminal domain-containing protein [Allosaccharopolyspora coralli]QGK71784.1 TetR family transcriptional regulator [Allosaccharopolyspora coralli]
MTAASTPKGERRRQALVVAAAELLVESGLDAIRHRAVAERAGLPLASTTYYFDSLDELTAAAVEFAGRQELAEGRERLAQLSAGPHGVDEVVELVLDLLLGHRSRHGGPESVLLRYERLVGSPRRPYLAPLMREMGDELNALLAEIFDRCGMPVDGERLFEIVALVDGAVVNALIGSDPDPRAVARRLLRSRLRGCAE